MIRGHKVIQISGKMGSGKSTLAKVLMDKLLAHTLQPLAVSETTYAKAIYEIHDYALQCLKDRGVIPKEVTKDGNLLQLLGTEWGRKTIDDQIWVKATQGEVANHFKMLQDKTAVMLVTDCRFKNEFHAFPDSLRVRLTCPKEIRKSRCHSWRDREDHISETDLDQYELEGHFDLLFPSDLLGPEEMADHIIKVLHENDWTKRRK